MIMQRSPDMRHRKRIKADIVSRISLSSPDLLWRPRSGAPNGTHKVQDAVVSVLRTSRCNHAAAVVVPVTVHTTMLCRATKQSRSTFMRRPTTSRCHCIAKRSATGRMRSSSSSRVTGARTCIRMKKRPVSCSKCGLVYSWSRGICNHANVILISPTSLVNCCDSVMFPFAATMALEIACTIPGPSLQDKVSSQ